MSQDITKIPEQSMGDVGHHTIKMLIASLIPIIGPVAAEYFAFIVAAPLQKRKDEWVQDIAKHLKDLEDKHDEVTPEKLSTNEAFVSTVMNASQIALRTHQGEKLVALRNAVLNSALPSAVDDDMQIIFLNFIDSFTPWHIRILKLFQSPTLALQTAGKSSQWSMGSSSLILTTVYPELENRREFYDKIVQDLNINGLLLTGSIHTTVTGSGMLQQLTTRMGNQFLDFISKPID